MPHPREIQMAVVNWLDERYPFTKSVDEALYQRVPNFANAFYYCFGGMVFILIVLLILTGILLALYYVPDATGNPASERVATIQFTRPLVRSTSAASSSSARAESPRWIASTATNDLPRTGSGISGNGAAADSGQRS